MHQLRLVFIFAILFAAACPEAIGAKGFSKFGSERWPVDLLSKAPATHPVPEKNTNNIKALFYETLPFRGKPTRAFAYLGLPAGASSARKVPAMVLVHGGGGSAFHTWVKLWNDRGYAAIAMDLNGHVPEGTYNNWKNHEFSGPAGISNPKPEGSPFSEVDEPIQDQWPFHAVANVALAHSLIRSLPEIDANKTGLTGLSWGGYTTCLVIGVDQRFGFAVPVYGCGFLRESSVWSKVLHDMGPGGEKWSNLWDPSQYLGHNKKVPMLWVTGTRDFAYPLDSVQKSYRLPASPRRLCITIDMPHGHGPAGEAPKEVHRYAETILHKGPEMPHFKKTAYSEGSLTGTFSSGLPIKKAELIYTTSAGPWPSRAFKALPVDLTPGSREIKAAVPADATVFYFNLTDESDAVGSSEHFVK